MKIKLVRDSRRRAREGRQKEIRVIIFFVNHINHFVLSKNNNNNNNCMSERCSKSAIKFPYTRLGSGLFCNNFVLQKERDGTFLLSAIISFVFIIALTGSSSTL